MTHMIQNRTRKPLLIFIFLLHVSTQATYNPALIIELFRHGARTPSRNTLKENYVDKFGPGNIIGNGERMHYILGLQIRKSYPNLFPKNKDTYLKKNQYVMYSTDYQRTILSAYSHLLGLFPFDTGLYVTGNLNNNENLVYVNPPYKKISEKNLGGKFALPYGINAFPVKVLPKYRDKIFMKEEENTCPNGYQLTKTGFKKFIQENQAVIQSVVDELKKAGIKAQDIFKTSPNAVFNLNTTGIYADIAKCNLFHKGNGESYRGITPELMNKLEDVFGLFYLNYRFNDQRMTQVYTSKMGEFILRELETRTKGGKMSYIGLSGHEANLVPFMKLFKLMSVSCLSKRLKGEKVTGVCETAPQFAANMIWELSQQKEDQKFYVRVLYNGKAIDTCSKSIGDKYCAIDDFKTYFKDNFIMEPKKYAEFCGKEILPKTKEISELNKADSIYKNKILWATLFFVGLIGSVVLLFIVYSLLRKVNLLQRKGKEMELNPAF